MKPKLDLRSLRRKDKKELRNSTIEVLLSSEEKLIILEKAKKARLPVSSYIRVKLLSDSPQNLQI